MVKEMMSEKDWQAEQDARILVEADKIRKEPSRVNAAKNAISNQKAALEDAEKVVGEGEPSSKGRVSVKNGIPQFGD